MFLSAFERPDFAERTAIIFRGDKFTYGKVAAEARDIAGGLQSLGVCQGDRVGLHFRNSDEFVASYAKTMAGNAPLSLIAAKRVVDELMKDPDRRDKALCDKVVADCFGSKDYIEGRRAFMEKRKPVFTGT